jgi:hypothetical protein
VSKITKLIDKSQNKPTDERIKLLLTENSKLRGQLAKRESGTSLITSVLKDVYSAPSNLRLVRPKVSRKKQTETAVLHITDTHYGKLTSTYNSAVCEDRFIQIGTALEEITDLRRKFAAINTLVILAGGDFVEGQDIFPAQQFSVDVDIVQQCLKHGPEVFANLVIRACQVFPEVEVNGVPGNHGRINKNGSPGFNSDSIFLEVVRGLVEKVCPGRVTWNLPLDREPGKQWFAYTNVEGYGIVVIHGDFKAGPSNSLGYPWYTLGRRVANWVDVLPEFSFVYVGHNHQWASFEVAGKMVLATGSTESNNDYAARNFASECSPHQRLTFFNEKHGLLSDIRIHLE